MARTKQTARMLLVNPNSSQLYSIKLSLLTLLQVSLQEAKLLVRQRPRVKSFPVALRSLIAISLVSSRLTSFRHQHSTNNASQQEPLPFVRSVAIKNLVSFSFESFPFSVLFAKSLRTSSPICAFRHPPSVLFKSPWRLISFPSLKIPTCAQFTPSVSLFVGP